MKEIFEKIFKKENETYSLITQAIKSKEGKLFTYLNQHCYNIYHLDREYKQLLLDKFTVYVDGIGLWMSLKLFGFHGAERFNATDLNTKVFEYLIETAYSLYIIGGNFDKETLLQKSASFGLNVTGYYNGYFEKTEVDYIYREVNALRPKLVVIGMGVPKQEIFAHQLQEKNKNLNVICVGNFLEFYFGNIKRIPKRFRNIGVEWLFRLLMEPKRLGRRYSTGIPLFLFLIIKNRFFSGKNKY